MSSQPLIQKSLSTTFPTSINIFRFFIYRRKKEFIKFNNNFTNSFSNGKSLNTFGRKKTVSFSNKISIINVDNWKSYNIDVSEVGGCMAWDMKKNEEKRLEEERRKKKLEEDGCHCNIF